MSDKKPRKRQKRASKSTAPDPALVAADRYIADQLKAIYDAVADEPVPDRLLELLNCLDGDAGE